MNTSCALQHFCDLHGPQTLLCTEEKVYMHDSKDIDNEGLKTFFSQYFRPENALGKVKCKVGKL